MTFYPQIELGTVATPYSPYVSNPIELCKIGNYVDKLKRAEGKQLFDKDNVTVGYINADGTIYSSATNYATSDFIPVQSNTAYYKTYTASPRTKFFNANKEPLSTSSYQDLSIGGNAGSFTTPANAVYFRFSFPTNGTATNIMLNEGETAQPYEPYGNVWYIEKNIGKVVLNGTETWKRIQVSASSSYAFWNQYVNLNIPVGKYGQKYCDRFEYQEKTWSLSTPNHLAENTASTNDLSILFNVDSTIATTVADWKTWLTNNNTTVYYVLATPTYTEITDSYLLEQLNNILDIELYENLCYVDWVGTLAGIMTLQYAGTEDLGIKYIITEDGKKIRTDWRKLGRRKKWMMK